VLKKISSVGEANQAVCSGNNEVDYVYTSQGWQQDDSVPCNYYIRQGFLYY
jgi:hypothetical protein